MESVSGARAAAPTSTAARHGRVSPRPGTASWRRISAAARAIASHEHGGEETCPWCAGLEGKHREGPTRSPSGQGGAHERGYRHDEPACYHTMSALPVSLSYRRALFLSIFAASVASACSDSTTAAPTTPTPAPTDPPKISCPVPQTIQSAGGQPMSVAYPAPTVAGGTAPVSSKCSPATESSFTIGIDSRHVHGDRRSAAQRYLHVLRHRRARRLPRRPRG